MKKLILYCDLGSKIPESGVGMRNSIKLLLAYLLLTAWAWSATPTFVNSVNGNNSQAHTMATGSVYRIPLPEPSVAGNLLVCDQFADSTGSPTFAISDDQSQTWSLGKTNTDASGNQINIWYKANTAANVHVITVTVTGTNSAGFEKVRCSQFSNVATTTPVDGTPVCHTQTTATAITSGSITPTVTGDLFYVASYNDSVPAVAQPTVGSQSNITWLWSGISRDSGDMAEYGVYNSTVALNPAMTGGTSGTWTACGIAFKAAGSTTGGAPATPYIAHITHIPVTAGQSSPVSFSFPSSGDTLIGGWSYAATGNISAASTTSPSNTFTPITASSAGGTSAQVIYATSTSTGNAMQGTFTLSGSVTDGTLVLADVVGLGAFDASANTSGTQSSQAALTVCSACLTPSTSSGMFVAVNSQTDCTVTSITSPAGGLLDALTNTIYGADGPQPVDQNNLSLMHYYNSSSSAPTITAGETCGTNNVNAWAAQIVHFNAPSVANSVNSRGFIF